MRCKQNDALRASEKFLRFLLYFFACVMVPPLVYAQSTGNTAAAPATAQNTGSGGAQIASSAATKISKGYNSILLGMSYQAASDALKNSPGFDYSGSPDVSLSPGRDERIIETRGGRFITHAILQFRSDVLFSITLDLNPDSLDYYTLYTRFSQRYGATQSLSPSECVWEDGTVRLILEKPLTLKYLDIATMDAVLKQSNVDKSAQEQTRDQFIDSL